MINQKYICENGISPWGRIEGIDRLFDGQICFVSTASHGGYLVPKELAEQRIPKEILGALFVRDTERLGFYAFEEDCDAAIAALYFPEILNEPGRINDVCNCIRGMMEFNCWDKAAREKLTEKMKELMN